MATSIEGACVIAVGDTYPIKFVNPGREFGVVNFFGGDYNSILIGLDNPTEKEIAFIGDADFRMGVVIIGCVILVIFVIEGFGIFDMSIDMQLYSNPILPEITSPETRLLIDVATIDINTSIVKALRAITLPPVLTKILIDFAYKQLHVIKYSQDEFQANMEIILKMSPQELVAKTHMFKLGE